jgi:hypothetical protein
MSATIPEAISRYFEFDAKRDIDSGSRPALEPRAPRCPHIGGNSAARRSYSRQQ